MRMSSDRGSTTTAALVARTVDYAESDRVVTLLTEAQGKISALARGARRSRRRFGAALGLFVVGRATVRRRRSPDALAVLERFEAAENLTTGIGSDLNKVAYGSYMLEAARELWPPEVAEPALFAHLLGALRALAGGAANSALLRSFELQLLTHLGLAPNLVQCVQCGDGVRGGQALGFSVNQGGVICSGCGPHGWPMSPDLWTALQQLGRLEIGRAGDFRLPSPVRSEARDLMLMVMRHHLGKSLQSLEFIRQLGHPRGR